ncbi:MAG: asparaginase [Candidatus Eisenbacteria bacterium]|nr:asparaginase [Candidatus Eisenbacteria bacterium]
MLAAAAAWGGAPEKPRVVILATGGTIAGRSVSAVEGTYRPAELPVEELLAAVPEIDGLARVTGEQLCQVASQDMTVDLWIRIARRVDELLRREDVDGVVITHGTDTMEETAWFLHLTVRTDEPIVLTGAMRPPGSLGADGALNLYNAVAVAASPESRGKGALLVMNDAIHGAREATKRHTTRADAFASPLFGPLGTVHYGDVVFYRESTRRHTASSAFDIREIDALPEAAILYGHAGFDTTLIDRVLETGARGIVFAGTGNGNPSAPAVRALARASSSGAAIVRSSRTGAGAVTLHAEVDDEALGFAVAGDLNPQKSRILLMLALTRAGDVRAIQEYFFMY